MSGDRAGRLAVVTYNHRWNLFTVHGAGPPSALTASTGREWDPDVAPHGGLLFISDQSGAPEVWVRADGGEPARLTRLGASFVHTPRWSPDGRRFAFIMDRDQQTDLWLMNADGSGLSRATRDGAPKADPVWDADGGALVYSERAGRTCACCGRRLGRRTGPASRGAGFRALRPGWDGALYGLKENDRRLWRLPRTGGVATLVSPTFEVEDGWATGPLGRLPGARGLTQTPSLWLRSWSGEERKLADLPVVAVNPIGGGGPAHRRAGLPARSPRGLRHRPAGRARAKLSARCPLRPRRAARSARRPRPRRPATPRRPAGRRRSC
jgi:hypothetical protein